MNKDKKTSTQKAVGKVSNLSSKVQKNITPDDIYTNGIAHTRWATHGKVTEENTHPHNSQNNRFHVVHNGIIENYVELKNKLSRKYHFYSETDSEVIAKLIEDLYTGDLQETLKLTCEQLVWAYAIAVIDTYNPDILIWVKLGSPMIIWEDKSGVYISSDINALWNITSEFISLDDGETVVVQNGKKQVFSLWKEIFKTVEVIDKTYGKADKWSFETFTEKEIAEIPEILQNVFKGRINFETKEIQNETLETLGGYDIENIEIIASGSSYFAGEVWKYWLRSLAGIPTEVRISSEFLYDTFLPNKKNALRIFIPVMRNSWCTWINQSGTTKMMPYILNSKCCRKYYSKNVWYVTLYTLWSRSMSSEHQKYYWSIWGTSSHGYEPWSQ